MVWAQGSRGEVTGSKGKAETSSVDLNLSFSSALWDVLGR